MENKQERIERRFVEGAILNANPKQDFYEGRDEIEEDEDFD